LKLLLVEKPLTSTETIYFGGKHFFTLKLQNAEKLPPLKPVIGEKAVTTETVDYGQSFPPLKHTGCGKTQSYF
jgi:hypothetical protein